MTGAAEKSDRATPRLVAALVGLVIGQIAASQAEVTAKIVLLVGHGFSFDPYDPTFLFQARLVVLTVFTFIGAGFGYWAAWKQWYRFDQVVLGVATAVFVVALTIINEALPGKKQGPVSAEALGWLYYIVWAIGLLIVPVFIYPSREGSFDERMKNGAFLLAVTGMGCVAGLAAGLVVQELPHLLQVLVPFTVDWITPGGRDPFKELFRFNHLDAWIARPATIDALAGGLVMVAFGPWLLPWQESERHKTCWVMGFSLAAIVLSGFFGSMLYFPGQTWFVPLVDRLPLRLILFAVFAGFPAAVLAAVAIWFKLQTRRPPVANLLATAMLTVGFALIATALALLQLGSGASLSQALALVLFHALNGLVLAGVLGSLRQAIINGLPLPVPRG